MKNGYFGKILWVDLTEGSFTTEELPEEIYEQYLGGVGLAIRLIYQHQRRNIDPLSTWGDANAGGIFGPEIKRCGYDAILIKGSNYTPKYISIIDEKKEILDATEIWGLDIIKAEEKLKTIHGSKIKTAGIGQAGENLSLISGIANDRGRIAARSGIGAIMGSKKLKMIVLKGNKKIPLHDKKRFIRAVQEYNKNVKSDTGKITKYFLNRIPKLAKLMRRLNMGMSGPSGLIQQVYRNLGTSAGNTIASETGDSPIKNWSGIGMYDFPYERSSHISSSELKKFKVRDYGCFSCPIRCGAILEVPEANLKETHLPEYETCAAFGMNLLNDDLISLLKVNEICNRAAIDTISIGATIAFAMECYENGILTKDDT
ncbi:MAG: aldehyde ferredoxin oxidoreductase N-terminal domain-containing protein, partial [Candidatus Lokiarchaeota archaeon]